MFVLKTIALFALSTVILSGGGAWGCRSSQIPLAQTEQRATPPVMEKSGSAQVKILAEGFHSSVTSPFVAVVRDAETYAALTSVDPNLPKLESDFFRTNTVVAAFLGERNTGGYSVAITRGAVDIEVSEKKPGKDMMVTQVITTPFKMVALEGVSNSPVWIALEEAWLQQVRSYAITTGKFKMSGGFAGTSEEFAVKGAVGVISTGNLATLKFRLEGTGGTKVRSLTDYATGIVGSGGRLNISQLTAGSFVSPPNSGLQADGKFNDPWTEFSLNLISRPSMVSDGYSGQGSIEARVEVDSTI